MPDLYMDVDVGLSEVPVNIMPLVDNTDFKSIEADVNYNAGGLVLIWHFVTTAGAYSQTAVTPTDTGGNYDWVEQGNGMFTIEIPASAGASINNDTEGFGWFTGVATGILPWRGPVIGFRKASMNNIMIDNGTLQDNLEDMFDGTGYIGGTIVSQANVTAIANNAITLASYALDAIAMTFFDSKYIDRTITLAAGAVAAQGITSDMASVGCIQYETVNISKTLNFAAPDLVYYALYHYDGDGNVDEIKPDTNTTW